jgi:hypothetical protein
VRALRRRGPSHQEELGIERNIKSSLRTVTAKNIPITKEPRILMNSVPYGNAAPNHAVAAMVHQWRAMPPRVLPIAIQK